jgi:hypothetical protein
MLARVVSILESRLAGGHCQTKRSDGTKTVRVTAVKKSSLELRDRNARPSARTAALAVVLVRSGDGSACCADRRQEGSRV